MKFDTQTSNSVDSMNIFFSEASEVHTYECVDPGPINAITIVSKRVKVPAITLGAVASSLSLSHKSWLVLDPYI